MIKMGKISLEIATRGVLCKTVFLNNWQNLQKNTYSKVSFLIKLQAEGYNFSIKETLKQVFSYTFTPFFYKQFIFDSCPQNYLSFSKKSPQKFFWQY